MLFLFLNQIKLALAHQNESDSHDGVELAKTIALLSLFTLQLLALRIPFTPCQSCVQPIVVSEILPVHFILPLI